MIPPEMSNLELLLAMVEMDTMSKEASQQRKDLTASISKSMTEQEQYKIMLSILEQDEIIINARKGMSELMAEAKVRREQLKDLIRRGEFSLEVQNEST
jgi:DNA-binding phage protein